MKLIFRAILPHFDEIDDGGDDGGTLPAKRRRLHLNDLPDEVLIKVRIWVITTERFTDLGKLNLLMVVRF